MKLPSTVHAISLFLLITSGRSITPPQSTSLTSLNPTTTITTNQTLTLNPRGKDKKPKKPKEPKKEPEYCESNSNCFWNHKCIDGKCQVGCTDFKDCKPPQVCYKGTCHWVPPFGRKRKCQLNSQKCIMSYHCCYHRCVFTKKVFGYCFAVDRGENAPGDEWGDLRPDDYSKFDNETGLEGRGLDLDLDLEDTDGLDLDWDSMRPYLDLEGGEDDGLDYEVVEKGKGPGLGLGEG